MKKTIYISIIGLLTLGFISQSVFASGKSISNSNCVSLSVIQNLSDENFLDGRSEIIEDWMVDIKHWDMHANTDSEIYSMYKIEDWMTDYYRWVNLSEVVEDNQFAIEFWMKNPCHWSLSKMEYCEDNQNTDNE